MEEYISIPAVVVIVYLIAEAVKAFGGENVKKYIPIICGACGAVLAALMLVICPEFIPAENVFEAIAIGIVSGFSATGINQLYKQLKKE